MNMLLIIAGLVIGAIIAGLLMDGAEPRRQSPWDQPNPRGGLR